MGVACQVRVLEHLGSEAPDELLAAALREARAVRGSGQAAWLLERLAPLVPRHLLPEAFATTLDVDDKFHRRNALRVLAARLAREDTDTRRKVLGRALEITAGRDRLDFFYDLSSLVPLLVSVGDDEALRGMIAAVRDCARWWRG